MNVLEVLALVAVVVAKKEGTAIDPTDFFGIEDKVKSIVESPNQAIRSLLKEFAGITWDGKTRLVETILGAAKDHCAADLILASEAVSERRYQDAMDILKYDRLIPHTLSVNVVRDAQQVVLDWKRQNEVEAVSETIEEGVTV